MTYMICVVVGAVLAMMGICGQILRVPVATVEINAPVTTVENNVDNNDTTTPSTTGTAIYSSVTFATLDSHESRCFYGSGIERKPDR